MRARSLALLMCGMARDGIAVQGIAHARKSRTHDIKGKVVVFVYTNTYIECYVFIKMILTLQRSKTVHFHAVDNQSHYFLSAYGFDRRRLGLMSEL